RGRETRTHRSYAYVFERHARLGGGGARPRRVFQGYPSCFYNGPNRPGYRTILADRNRSGRDRAVKPPASSTGACGTKSLFEFCAEFLELFGIEIADCQQVQPLLAPSSYIESLHDLNLGRWQSEPLALRHKQIDNVHATAIDDRSYRLAVNKIEPAADQSKTFRSE